MKTRCPMCTEDFDPAHGHAYSRQLLCPDCYEELGRGLDALDKAMTRDTRDVLIELTRLQAHPYRGVPHEL